MRRLALIVLVACRTGGPPPTIATPPAPAPAPKPPPAPSTDWPGMDWTKPPADLPETTFAPPRVEEFSLANGVRVHLIENHRLPLVSVRVICDGAGSSDDHAQAGLASLTADLLDQGAGSRSALELPEELERLGARLSVGAHADHTSLTLDTLAETLEPSLAVAADVLLRPRLTAADFERVKAERLADLALRPDQPRAMAGLVFERVIFGDHPYGSPGAGWIASVGKLKLADVKRYWRSHYGASGSTIVVAGDVTRPQLEAMLGRTFGAWKGKTPPRISPDGVVPSRSYIAVVDRPGAEQSVVTIGGEGPSISDGHRVELDLITTAVGGTFSARLNRRLREELGYTYGIYASVWRGRWAGAWSVTSAIRTDVTVPAIREVLDILATASSTLVPDDELARTKSQMIRSLPQSFETNGSIASTYANLVVESQPSDYYVNVATSIDVAWPESIKASASRWWWEPKIIVVGDWSKIGNDLAKLRLPIVRYSADGHLIK